VAEIRCTQGCLLAQVYRARDSSLRLCAPANRETGREFRKATGAAGVQDRPVRGNSFWYCRHGMSATTRADTESAVRDGKHRGRTATLIAVKQRAGHMEAAAGRRRRELGLPQLATSDQFG